MAPDSTPTTGLHIRHAPAARGVAWVTQSFALFFKHPLGFSLLLMLFLGAVLLLVLLPLVGPLLLVAAMPLLTLGFAAATRAALAGKPVHAGHLIEALGAGAPASRRLTLLRLCLVYTALTALVMLLAQAVDGGGFERLHTLMTAKRTDATRQQIDALLAEPRLRNGMALRLLLLSALSVPFWHAPMLVAWQGQGLAQALFSSTLACWRNRGAFCVYTLAWIGFSVALGLFAGLAVALLGSPQMASLLLPPAALMFAVVFYVSLYFVYADSFGTGDAAAAGMSS
jgi:hypothetical protein